MLGLREDAEDVLQDAWLRFADVDLGSVGNSRAYLVTIVTRLSMDVFKSARRRREEYVGTWLPEPVSSDVALPDDLAEQADSVSFAFLILLERLTPTQRAVLVAGLLPRRGASSTLLDGIRRRRVLASPN